MAAAVGGVCLGERLLNRLRGAVPVATAIDYRFVAVGALIPDAIDKPLARAGIEALSYDQTAGHSIGHTLVASLAVIAVGSLLASRGNRRLLWLGLGSVTHLLVDPVVAYPGVLMWPLFGFDPPWPYLIGFDVLLVAASVLAYGSRKQFKGAIFRFVRRGEIAWGEEGRVPGERGVWAPEGDVLRRWRWRVNGGCAEIRRGLLRGWWGSG